MAEPTPAAAAPQTEPEDLPAQLEQLKASATKEYSLKNYDAAAELYSEAAQIQDQINGEMSPENADLLYLYGRCLYHVAVSNSDVLGGKVASTEEPKRKKRKVSQPESSGAAAANAAQGSSIADAIKEGEERTAEELVAAAVEEKDGTIPGSKDIFSNNPYFQITGDENFTDSEDEGDEEEDGQAEEEEDDFATAYEILDMARVLLSRKLESLEDLNKEKKGDEKPELRHLRERLADTHDLQAEISLENERFHDAINDTRDALAFKLQLYPQESSLVAEAHFKLSLALEFASVTSTEEAPNGDRNVAQIDEEMRKEAAKEMEFAIASCKARVLKEETSLATLEEAKAAELNKSILDVKEMVGDMEQRLQDLRKPAVSLSAMQGIGGPAGAPAVDRDPLEGILGTIYGESKVEQAKRLEQATQNANDLTGMIKKKKPKQEAATAVPEGKGKRKAEDSEADSGATNGNGNGKKIKFEVGEPTEIE